VQQESRIRARPADEPDIKKEPESLYGEQEQEITMILANMILQERHSIKRKDKNNKLSKN